MLTSPLQEVLCGDEPWAIDRENQFEIGVTSVFGVEKLQGVEAPKEVWIENDEGTAVSATVEGKEDERDH